MTSRTGIVGWDLRKVRSWVSISEEDGWLSELAEADGKVVIERLCLSLPHVEKPFNSKVIKSFVPELRSRKCLFFLCVSGFLCYPYVRYEHSVYISRIHVWVCNIRSYSETPVLTFWGLWNSSLLQLIPVPLRSGLVKKSPVNGSNRY